MVPKKVLDFFQVFYMLHSKPYSNFNLAYDVKILCPQHTAKDFFNEKLSSVVDPEGTC